MCSEVKAGTGTVLKVENRGAVRVLRLNRPSKLNTLNTGLLAALHDELKLADADGEVRALVLGGEGCGFSAGTDLNEFRGDTSANAVELTKKRNEHMFQVQQGLRSVTKPIVAAIHGPTMGAGAVLALCCDIVLASDNLALSDPELEVRMAPTGKFASSVRQARLKRVFELESLGNQVDAVEAYRMGIVTRVVTQERLQQTAIEIASTWAAVNPSQMATMRYMFRNMIDLSFEAGLVLGCEVSASMRNAKPGNAN